MNFQPHTDSQCEKSVKTLTIVKTSQTDRVLARARQFLQWCFLGGFQQFNSKFSIFWVWSRFRPFFPTRNKFIYKFYLSGQTANTKLLNWTRFISFFNSQKIYTSATNCRNKFFLLIQLNLVTIIYKKYHEIRKQSLSLFFIMNFIHPFNQSSLFHTVFITRQAQLPRFYARGLFTQIILFSNIAWSWVIARDIT